MAGKNFDQQEAASYKDDIQYASIRRKTTFEKGGVYKKGWGGIAPLWEVNDPEPRPVITTSIEIEPSYES